MDSLKNNKNYQASYSLKSKLGQPRALKTLSKIIDGDLCHRCGTCVGICPTDVLGVDDNEYPAVKSLSACTDCDLCVKVCPGEEFDSQSFSKELFDKELGAEDMHGSFQDAYLSYSTDEQIRENATSGGLVTGLLVSLLEQGLIDGAVLITSDKETPWKGSPVVARSKEEIIEASKSKYAISPTNVMLSEIRKVSGRYALVGLPCQIHGFLKAASLNPIFKQRVVLTIGLFCHAAVEHEPMDYIWKNIPGNKEEVEGFISRVGKHPGTPHIKFKNKKLEPVYFPKAKGYRPSSMEVINVLYRLYTPARCLTCYDSTSEYADIAVGDPWMKAPDDVNFLEGYSFCLARTKSGVDFLKQAENFGSIFLKKIGVEQAKTSNTMMGEEKRWRAFRVIETRKRQGLPTPTYGFEIPTAKGLQLVLTEINMLSHIFCYLKYGKKFLLKITFSPIGYWLLWLNHKKRAFRNWRRDSFGG